MAKASSILLDVDSSVVGGSSMVIDYVGAANTGQRNNGNVSVMSDMKFFSLEGLSAGARQLYAAGGSFGAGS
jgi:hypothetical protein